MSGLNWVKPLILAVVLSVVAAIVFWSEFERAPEKERLEENEKKIFALDDQVIESIRIIDGDRFFSFKCLDTEDGKEQKKLCKTTDQSRWQLTAPMTAPADKNNVNRFLSTANNQVASRVLDLSEETDEKKKQLFTGYGLDESSRSHPGAKRVEIKILNGSKYIAYLGKSHPIGSRIFAAVSKNNQIDMNRVFLIDSSFEKNLEKDLAHWRDKTLFTLSSSDIETFELHGSEADFKAKKEMGKWSLTLESGEVIPGDMEAINGFLGSLNYLKAKDFPSDDKKSKDGLQILTKTKKLVTLKLKAKGKPEATFTVFRKKGSKKKGAKGKEKTPGDLYYGTHSDLDPVFALESTVKGKVDRTLDSFRPKRLVTSMERFNVKAMEIEGSDWKSQLSLRMDEKKGTWSSQDSGQGSNDTLETLDSEKTKTLLSQLAGKKIIGFSKKEKEGSPHVTVKLSDAKGQLVRTLRFWKKKGELFAKELGTERKEVFKLDKTLDKALPWKKESLLQKIDLPELDQKKKAS